MRTVIRFSCAAVLLAASLAGAYAQAPATQAAPAAATAAGTAAAVDETTLVLPDAAAPGAAAASDSMLPYFLRMVLVLALVIGVIYALYVILKRSARPAAAQDSYLRVLASTNLAAGRSLHVVSLGDSAWLVGSTDASVNLISELRDKELIDALALRAAEAPQTPRKDFPTMLGELLGRKGGRGVSMPDTGEFFSRQKDRLKKF